MCLRRQQQQGQTTTKSWSTHHLLLLPPSLWWWKNRNSLTHTERSQWLPPTLIWNANDPYSPLPVFCLESDSIAPSQLNSTAQLEQLIINWEGESLLSGWNDKGIEKMKATKSLRWNKKGNAALAVCAQSPPSVSVWLVSRSTATPLPQCKTMINWYTLHVLNIRN